MERVLADMPKLNRGFNQVEATYTLEELKILRRQGPITQKMGDKLVQQVMLLAAELFSTAPKVAKLPRGPEVRNTFIFRLTICAYALALRLISVGGAGKTHPEKLRNDLVDVNFATFATFFDGFLSADKRGSGDTRSASTCFGKFLRCRRPCDHVRVNIVGVPARRGAGGLLKHGAATPARVS